MTDTIDTAFGVLKLLPDVIQIGKDVWKQLKPPQQINAVQPKDGIVGDTYYSADYKFSIAIPDDAWEFWRPSPQFLASFGAMFTTPSRAMPIVILSKHMIKLYRPSVNVTVESVGQYTNIDEMIQMSVMLLRQIGVTIDDKDVHIDNANQSGMIGSSFPYYVEPGYQVQQCYLRDGLFYTITASYVPMSSLSKKLFGGLQEIVNSFKLIQP